jgi:polysaccharide export outer membrane protein
MALKHLASFGLFAAMLHCTTAAGAQPAASAVSATPVASASASDSGSVGLSGPADYKLGVGDHLRVGVYNEPDLSGEVAVSATGTISLPLIGTLNILGDTASQAAMKIQTALSGRYLKDPHVSVEMLTYRPFYILGEVTRPGEYPYSNGLTVLNAVATAQGFTYRASKKFAFVKHAGESDEHKVVVKPETEVQPGDTVRIGERHF